ncbi:MAG: hypothetical protein MUF64_17265 [Polyangiaceae bacterium]|nr:hypothetical protein [Polyangiaceae bacterium]
MKPRASLLLAALLLGCAPVVPPETTVRGLTLPVRDPTPRPPDDDDPRESPPETEPTAPWAPPSLQRESLPSGIELLQVQRPGLSRVELRLVLRGAGLDAEGPSRGLAIAALQLCLEGGTSRLSPRDLVARWRSLGATFELHSRADATILSTSVLQANLREVLALLLQALREPRLDPGELARIRQLRQPPLPGHPEAWLPNLSRRERTTTGAAPAIGVPEIKAFLRDHMGPAALSLVLVGELEAIHRQTLEQGTATWKSGASSAATPAPTIPHPDPPRIYLVDQPRATVAELWLVSHGPPQGEGALALRLAGEAQVRPSTGAMALALQGPPLLGTSPQLRWFDEAAVGQLSFQTSVDAVKVPTALGAMVNALRRPLEPLPDPDFQALKLRHRSALQQRMAHPRHLADDLARQAAGRPEETPERWLERLQKVEVGRLSEAAQAHLSRGWHALILGPAEALGGPLQRLGEVLILDPHKEQEPTRTLPFTAATR